MLDKYADITLQQANNGPLIELSLDVVWYLNIPAADWKHCTVFVSTAGFEKSTYDIFP